MASIKYVIELSEEEKGQLKAILSKGANRHRQFYALIYCWLLTATTRSI